MAEPEKPNYLVSDEVLNKYLQGITAFIFENSNSAKNMITAALREMGMPVQNILFSKSYSSALEIIKKEKPTLFISEYEVRGKFGLELLFEVKKYVAEPIFILATSTASETSVAEAAEEDVDSYIVKPFMHDQLLKYIRTAIEYRIDPPPYIAKIKEGKVAIENKDVSAAKRIFFEASTIGEKPSLALFYLGQINEAEKRVKDALDLYIDGLTYIPLHYKCMTAKFEALDEMKRPDEAYEVVKEILKHYPVTPQRLGRMIYLAMITRHFTDVEDYYDIYQRLENRTEKLQVIVKAALFTTGKYLIQAKDYERARNLFEKAVLCSKRNLEVINTSVKELLKVGQLDLAKSIVGLVSQDDFNSALAKQTEFQVVYFGGDKDHIVRFGSEIIENDQADQFVYEKTIEILLLQDSERLAQKFANKGSQKFPELSKYL